MSILTQEDLYGNHEITCRVCKYVAAMFVINNDFARKFCI